VSSFILTALTINPALIQSAAAAGVDRIGIDIESRGKVARQGHIPNARLSSHCIDDLATVAAFAGPTELFIRLNPFYDGTRAELDHAIGLGAKVLMLPFYTTPFEVETFVKLVDGRAKPVILLETAAAAACLRETLSVGGFTEVMVGLNDLSLSLGLRSPFDVVVSELLSRLADSVLAAGLRFGFGGLARIDDPQLPLSADLVAAQYPRLGATAAWLSRSFFRVLKPDDLGVEVHKLRGRLDHWSNQPPAVLDARRDELALLLSRS
jgi:citrate lyase beta subunit